MEDNPFERYGLDPREGIEAITETLRELIEGAGSDLERERIVATWEDLTLHPARRRQAALFAHPETREPLGREPAQRRRAQPPAVADLAWTDLCPLPSVASALARARGPSAERAPAAASSWVDESWFAAPTNDGSGARRPT